jgi:hypothetical protein
MLTLVANLSLNYIDDTIESRVITIFSDDNIIVDKKVISINMEFCLSGTTIKIVIERMKNKGYKYRLIFYLTAILDIVTYGYDAETGSVRGLKSIVNSRFKYVLNLKITGKEAYISVKFDANQTKYPFSIGKSNNIEVVSCEKTRNK